MLIEWWAEPHLVGLPLALLQGQRKQQPPTAVLARLFSGASFPGSGQISFTRQVRTPKLPHLSCHWRGGARRNGLILLAQKRCPHPAPWVNSPPPPSVHAPSLVIPTQN